MFVVNLFSAGVCAFVRSCSTSAFSALMSSQDLYPVCLSRYSISSTISASSGFVVVGSGLTSVIGASVLTGSTTTGLALHMLSENKLALGVITSTEEGAFGCSTTASSAINYIVCEILAKYTNTLQEADAVPTN